MRVVKLLALAGGTVAATSMAVLAADSQWALGDTAIYQKSLAALTLLFVIAVLLENALSIIFNWRVFLAYFSRSGIKTIIMVVAALIVVNVFGIDIVEGLVSAYKTEPISSGPVSKFITALILAGGSAGVYNIMYALGYRSDRREAEVNAKPPPTKAWIAVRVTRRNAVGPVYVKVQEIGAAAAVSGAPAPIAGTITFRRQSLRDLLFRNTDRFPQSGGYVVNPNVVYAIVAEGKDAAGTSITALDHEQYCFAPGAIVDFSATL